MTLQRSGSDVAPCTGGLDGGARNVALALPRIGWTPERIATALMQAVPGLTVAHLGTLDCDTLRAVAGYIERKEADA